MDGFYGKIVVIDLTKKQSTIETIPDRIYEAYLGGKGLSSYLLYHMNPAGIDPMASDNHLIFATGPATGSRIWGGSRYGVFTKSPLTGIYAESYSGGRVPEAMDAAGFDAVVIKGKSPEPLILRITPDKIDFLPADDVWGMETFATEDVLKERFFSSDYKKSGSVVIGPAAENGVRFAIISNDYWRCAGRTGVGTVMGSKRLKAVIFQGSRSRSLHDPDAVNRMAKKMAQECKNHPGVQAYKSKGTPMMVDILNNVNGFPTKYWQQGSCPHQKDINADALHHRCKVTPKSCARCFMACGRMTEVIEGRHKGMRIEGPEYETIYAFGGLCMVESIEEIIYLNDLCDRLGMDTITAGNLCAFAIEASQHKKIDIDLKYGDVDAIATLLRQISMRQGIGDTLSQGIRHAAQTWGLEDIAVHVKGMEPAGYDPRALKGMGLAYAVSDRGACHLRTTFYKPELAGLIDPHQIEGKAEMLIDFEDRLTLFDTLILCRFYRDLYDWDGLGEMIKSITGIHSDKAALKYIAAAVADVVRKFNIREGMSMEDDQLPKPFYEIMKGTNLQISESQMAFMLRDYYHLRGWNLLGVPKS
jgi:aldehyde:ferredoxin oxidoreductase